MRRMIFVRIRNSVSCCHIYLGLMSTPQRFREHRQRLKKARSDSNPKLTTSFFHKANCLTPTTFELKSTYHQQGIATMVKHGQFHCAQSVGAACSSFLVDVICPDSLNGKCSASPSECDNVHVADPQRVVKKIRQKQSGYPQRGKSRLFSSAANRRVTDSPPFRSQALQVRTSRDGMRRRVRMRFRPRRNSPRFKKAIPGESSK